MSKLNDFCIIYYLNDVGFILKAVNITVLVSEYKRLFRYELNP